jgi:malonyl CoA-acyl carrier protein transacylase
MTATLAAPQARPAPTHHGWDSEVFVLRGDDRAVLRERAASLAASVERQPAARLAELAASLAADLAPGGARLGVVATSTADLVTKLRRAADRLADPKCRHIRDTAGVYFAAEPLYHQGALALLFPGEGAQYPGMLADLCGVFPDVEETFALCDRLAAEFGRPSLRGVLHPPPEEREAAEAELRKLGPSIFGVLLADLAVTRVLQNLELPVSAIAGHSAGELAALLTAGALPSDSAFGPGQIGMMDLMQRLEDEAGGPEVALLAVGAGKATVEEVAAAVAGGSVMVAMDNCPHQCVAVGPAHPIAAVEAALPERGLVCERLPFRRPYHTPLFEPWMGPFRELFAGFPFERPHTPVYSCSTGGRFPDDPDAIRDLAVNHWVSPVEFARMIETMYADGVRLFVEAGPRGNLSAFVEDVLRGRPFAAVPANVPRKSGPTQINHLVAQLAAHHVPLNLGWLYAGRTSPGSAAVPAAARRVGEPEDLHRSGSEGVGIAAGTAAHPGVIDGYLAAMERFLDVQREVMQAYLAGRGTPGALPPELLALPDLATTAVHSALSTQHSALPLALVGEVTHHEPGRAIVFRRPLDEREDLYADDHTLGGRGVSRVDPGQNGLPVLPMTFSLEAMAEAASLLAPGKVVIAVRNVRLYRWVPFDPEPTTLEVRAAVASVDPQTGTVEVKADVRDLGNSFLADGANKPACEAVIVLADRYPEPPQPQPFRLTDETMCQSTVEDLRRNMFHGPLFQMIQTLGRIGKEGIEGTLQVQPRDRWFRSNPDPHVVLDPVLTDAAMHILGAWHLEQPDWSGRILLPIGLQSLEYFGPPPPAGTWMLTRGHNEEETARQVRHGLEVFGPDGRMWLRLTGAAYWRFYLPFVHVNFFGPKDSTSSAATCPRVRQRGAAEDAGSDAALRARSPAATSSNRRVDLSSRCCGPSGARVTMTAAREAEFRAWTGTDAELNDWFFGRLLAKDAVRAAWNEKHGEAIFPADIETRPWTTGGIVCRPRGEPGRSRSRRWRWRSPTGQGGGVRGVRGARRDRALPVKKGEPEDEVRRPRRPAGRRRRAAGDRPTATLAVPNPGRSPARSSSPTPGRRLRVQTARQKNLVVATTSARPNPHEPGADLPRPRRGDGVGVPRP